MKITIELTEQQMRALRGEYYRKGLDADLSKFPGNKPGPIDQVIKQIVEHKEENQ